MKTVLGLLAACLFAGCAQTYHLRVDALADPETGDNGQSFTLENGFPENPGSSLRYQEVADFVGRALRARGHTPAEEPADADWVITVSASISEPLNETERTLEPIYYRTWGHSRIVRTPVVDQKGKVHYIATRIYLPPETYFAGYSGYDRSVVVYEKQLELTARTQEGEEVWTLRVEAVDRSSDLRSYLPYLVAAATPYLGEATDGSVVVRVKEGGETVQYLKGMAASPGRSEDM